MQTHKKICIRHNKHCYANNCEILGEMEKQNLSTLKQEEMEILHIQITIIEIEIHNYKPSTKKTKGQIATNKVYQC